MKSKIFAILFVITIAIVAAFNVTLHTQDTNLSMSSLSLANVDALADEKEPVVDMYCCGNSDICFVAEFEEPEGRKDIIVGRLSFKPCK